MDIIRSILIDTDIGDDIDDALAIALALRSPELKLVGITTVHKNTALRARIAMKLLEVFERADIPVASGLGLPLQPAWQIDCNEIPSQYEAVEDASDCNYDIMENKKAVDFLIDCAERYPDITIVTMGALTNIASAILRSPETFKKASLVIMGGIISNPYPEGNINTDPEAAKIVFESGMNITMVGLDVTLKCTPDPSQVEALQQSVSPQGLFLNKLMKIWKVRYLAPIMRRWGLEVDDDCLNAAPSIHDAVALGYVLRPDLFKIKKAHILIETKGEFTRGVTVDSINVFNGTLTGYNADVCIGVQAKRLAKIIFKRLLL